MKEAQELLFKAKNCIDHARKWIKNLDPTFEDKGMYSQLSGKIEEYLKYAEVHKLYLDQQGKWENDCAAYLRREGLANQERYTNFLIAINSWPTTYRYKQVKVEEIENPEKSPYYELRFTDGRGSTMYFLLDKKTDEVIDHTDI
jgi:hypothetical protein